MSLFSKPLDGIAPFGSLDYSQVDINHDS